MTPIDRLRLHRVEAEARTKTLSDGRNKGIVLDCDGPDGRREAVVKLSMAMNPLEWLLEWVASAIAQGLGLPVAEPCCVELTPAFCKSQPTKVAPGLVFGSTYVKGGASVPVNFKPESEKTIAMAAQIMAFDALVHNPDRLVSNPNLLLMPNDEFLVIDHDLAFSWLFELFGNEPARQNVARERWMMEHCLQVATRSRLRRVPENMREAMAKMDDAYFTRIAEMTPPEWQSGHGNGKLAKVVGVTKDRLACLGEWLTPLENGWLQ